MNNAPLMEAVVLMALFLELSDSATVNEDAAVEMMEQLAATLQQLNAAERDSFISYLKQRASRTESLQEQQTLESLANNLGLTAE
jgi:hypothetical protein